MRNARKLLTKVPNGCWIYWKENTMNLMALDSNGKPFSNENDETSKTFGQPNEVRF